MNRRADVQDNEGMGVGERQRSAQMEAEEGERTGMTGAMEE